MNFTMSFSELMPLAPVMIVALTMIVVMILTAIKRNHNLIATASVVGLNLAVGLIKEMQHLSKQNMATKSGSKLFKQ